MIIDTNIIIELLRGENKEVIKKIRSKFIEGTLVYITSISIAEVYYGCEKSQHKVKSYSNFKGLLNNSNIKVLDFNSHHAKIFGILKNKLTKSGSIIDNTDLFIASIALQEKMPIFTLDKKHFPRLEKYDLEILS